MSIRTNIVFRISFSTRIHMNMSSCSSSNSSRSGMAIIIGVRKEEVEEEMRRRTTRGSNEGGRAEWSEKEKSENPNSKCGKQCLIGKRFVS